MIKEAEPMSQFFVLNSNVKQHPIVILSLNLKYMNIINHETLDCKRCNCIDVHTLKDSYIPTRKRDVRGSLLGYVCYSCCTVRQCITTSSDRCRTCRATRRGNWWFADDIVYRVLLLLLLCVCAWRSPCCIERRLNSQVCNRQHIAIGGYPTPHSPAHLHQSKYKIYTSTAVNSAISAPCDVII